MNPQFWKRAILGWVVVLAIIVAWGFISTDPSSYQLIISLVALVIWVLLILVWFIAEDTQFDIPEPKEEPEWSYVYKGDDTSGSSGKAIMWLLYLLAMILIGLAILSQI